MAFLLWRQICLKSVGKWTLDVFGSGQLAWILQTHFITIRLRAAHFNTVLISTEPQAPKSVRICLLWKMCSSAGIRAPSYMNSVGMCVCISREVCECQESWPEWEQDRSPLPKACFICTTQPVGYHFSFLYSLIYCEHTLIAFAPLDLR